MAIIMDLRIDALLKNTHLPALPAEGGTSYFDIPNALRSAEVTALLAKSHNSCEKLRELANEREASYTQLDEKFVARIAKLRNTVAGLLRISEKLENYYTDEAPDKQRSTMAEFRLNEFISLQLAVADAWSPLLDFGDNNYSKLCSYEEFKQQHDDKRNAALLELCQINHDMDYMADQRTINSMLLYRLDLIEKTYKKPASKKRRKRKIRPSKVQHRLIVGSAKFAKYAK